MEKHHKQRTHEDWLACSILGDGFWWSAFGNNDLMMENFSRKKANSTYNLIPKTCKPYLCFNYLFLIKDADFY